MELIPLLSIISPMTALTIFVVVMLHYFSGMGKVSDYEKELKNLRHNVLKGELGQKTYLYIKDNLKVENLYDVESSRRARKPKHQGNSIMDNSGSSNIIIAAVAFLALIWWNRHQRTFPEMFTGTNGTE